MSAHDRTVTGFWFVWASHWEWPEQHYGEDGARRRAAVVVKSNPGIDVYVCQMKPIEKHTLPDTVVVAAL